MKNVIQPNVEVLKWARKSVGYTLSFQTIEVVDELIAEKSEKHNQRGKK